MIRDGTQERQLDPPEQEPTYTERELRAMDDAAQRGFDAMDERARKWLDEQLADTPEDVGAILRYTFVSNGTLINGGALRDDAIERVRDRYIYECGLDYAGDV